jgi:hypothetical protein
MILRSINGGAAGIRTRVFGTIPFVLHMLVWAYPSILGTPPPVQSLRY